MKLALPALASICVLALAGCPDDPKNPPRLWLVLDGSEVQVKLAPVEPPYY